jgi:iron complex outermembrane receptor protein
VAGALAFGGAAALAGAPARAQEPGGEGAEQVAEASPIEVTVSGEALLPRAASDRTAATTVLEGDDLRAPGESTAEALSRAPGVQIARAGAAGELATASLRGATTAQTPIYLAGVRLNDDVTGTADLATVPLFWMRRAEVWRGASPAWVERPGLAGAVLLEPELPSRTRIGASAGVGSFGQRFAWIGGAVGDERASAAFALRGDAATNDFTYVDDAGTRFEDGDDVVRTRPNADVRSGDAWALARLAAGRRTTLTMILNGFLREQGVTGLAVVPARRARATTRRELAAVTSRTLCGPSAAADACAVELRTSALRTTYELDDPRRELGYGVDAQVTRGRRLTEDARVVVRPADALAIDAGAGASIEGVDVTPIGAEGVVARRTAARAHVEGVVTPGDALELRAAGVLNHDATRGAGTSSEVTSPMARLAARIAATRWLAFFGSVARSVRVPTLGETFGASAILRGNPELAPERGLGGELGARAEGDRGPDLRGSIELLGFARVADDLIAYRRTSIGGVRPFNVGQGRILGGELAAAADVARHVRADLAVTVLDPRDATAPDGERDLLPYLARLVVAPSIELYDDDPLALDLVERAAIAARLVYRGERVADGAGLIVLPSQAWLDLEATVSLAEDRIALRARLANVLDDDATDTLGLPLPGRSVHVAAEAWWN